MDSRLQSVVNTYVRDGWRVTTQSENAVSLEKPEQGCGLIHWLILGFALFMFAYSGIAGLILLICAVGFAVLTLILAKAGTMNISVLPDGSIQVASNFSKLNRLYSPDETLKLKHRKRKRVF